MANHRFTLSVRGSKAVESADIVLDEITVLSGVNAAGKSTLARMFNLLVNMSQNYPSLAQKTAWKDLNDIAVQIRLLDNRFDGKPDFFGILGSGPDFESMVGHGDFFQTLNELKDFSLSVLEKYRLDSSSGDRPRAFGAFLRSVGVGVEYTNDVDGLRNILIGKIESARDKYRELCSKRAYEVYNNTSRSEANWLVDADYVCFKEGNQIVYETKRNPSPPPIAMSTSDLKEIYGIRQAFYIASPWFSVPSIDKFKNLTMPGDEFVHTPSSLNLEVDEDLFELLDGSFDKKDAASNKSTDNDNAWVYKRKEGLEVDFKDCATGLKSLAVLNLLYKNKYLDSETLLIIDEPEVHLHPQWVVQYAKILVQICAKFKTRLLLTSHSPDMVSALKVMAEVEGVSGVNFYLANQSKTDKYRYSYQPLGNTIEKIFECFGKSIEAIDDYKPYVK